MPRLHRRGQRGFTIMEVLISSFIGVFVLGGVSSMYLMTARALDESSSQAALQRVGTLAAQTIARQAARASSNPTTAPDASCVQGTPPAGSFLVFRVTDTTPPSIPAGDRGTYCYYPTATGQLCQRIIPDSTGVAGPCWDLLSAPQPGMKHLPYQAGKVKLVTQTNPTHRYCPQKFDGTAIAATNQCLALAMNAGTQQTGDLAFGITDDMSYVTFSSSFMLLNHP